MRLKPEERRFAVALRSSWMMTPRGLATFPDGGRAIRLHDRVDVWICDPQERFARRVATLHQPDWIRGRFDVWMIDWKSDGERSALYLRLSGTEGSTSASPRVRQHARVEFDRKAATNAKIFYLGSPQTLVKPSDDMVNERNPHGFMDVRRSRGDTLSVWTDGAPDRIVRFWVDKNDGRIMVLGDRERRLKGDAGPRPYYFARECPERIEGIRLPAASRISFGGTPHSVKAEITRVDASCRSGVIGARAWIEYEIEDSESLGEHDSERFILFQALSASSELIGSESVSFRPAIGAKSGTVSMGFYDMTQAEALRVVRVAACWVERRP